VLFVKRRVSNGRCIYKRTLIEVSCIGELAHPQSYAVKGLRWTMITSPLTALCWRAAELVLKHGFNNKKEVKAERG